MITQIMLILCWPSIMSFHPFLPTAAAPMLVTWFYQSLPLFFLCSPFLSPLLCRWQVVVALLHGFMKDLVTAVITEEFITPSFCWKSSVKCWSTLKMKHNCLAPFHCDSLIVAVTSESSVFPYIYSGKKRLFMLFSVDNAV